MKRIEAIVRPHKLPSLLAELAKAGITNVTVSESLGLARQVSHSRIYEPVGGNPETKTGLIPKRLLLLFLEDPQVQPVLDLLQANAFTGEPGDGVIAVSQIDQLVHIRPRTKAAPAA